MLANVDTSLSGLAPMIDNVTAITSSGEAHLTVLLWWVLLSVSALANIAYLSRRFPEAKSADPYTRKMIYCATMFCIGCAVRSIWPRVDVERICFWDSWVSVTFVGRVLATCAEICFGWQFSMVIVEFSEAINFSRTRRFGYFVFWAICCAQCCCWMGVTTRRQIWHCVEESIWGLTFAGIAVAFAVLYHGQPTTASVFDYGNDGYAKRVLAISLPGLVGYVIFMFLVDVPMYANRYIQDQARGATYLWVSEGIVDTLQCKTVSRSWGHWEPEMPWMTGYFVGATAFSLWLSHGPRFSKRAD